MPDSKSIRLPGALYFHPLRHEPIGVTRRSGPTITTMTSAHLNRLFLLFTTFLYISLVNGGPIGPHQQNRHVVDELPVKRDSQAVNDGGAFFSILGVRGLGDSSIHPRLEIRELEKNADQWNVYLLGLNRFQQMNQTDKLSYYQIAGKSYIQISGSTGIPFQLLCSQHGIYTTTESDLERTNQLLQPSSNYPSKFVQRTSINTNIHRSSLIYTIGIHGRPFIPWDGAAQAPGGGGGYCTHSSNLFPTWHRPFLALFEVCLH